MSAVYVDSIKDKSNTKTLATLSNSAVTLHSDVLFPSGAVVKVYYAEYTLSATTTYAAGSWHDIPSLSITTDTPKSTSSKFVLWCHTVHSSNADWSAKFRFYNTTTGVAVINETTKAGS